MAKPLRKWLRKRRPDLDGQKASATVQSKGLLSPELERRLAGLRFNFTHSMDGRLTGVHRSAQPGVSVEFSDHKEYSPGDDIRRLNWKVYARSDKFYVRQFAKDTHANIYLVLDGSGSMDYCSRFAAESKALYAARLGMILAHIFLRQNDAVGLITVRGNRMANFVPARSHPSHLITLEQHLAQALEQAEGVDGEHEGATSMAEGLEYLISSRVSRSAVILLSDMFLVPEELFPYLAYLKSGGNFMWLLQVLDPAEFDIDPTGGRRTFPFEGTMLFRSNETPLGVMMDSKLARPEYLGKFGSFLDNLQARCAEIGVELSRCNTDADPVEFLLEYLLRRQ